MIVAMPPQEKVPALPPPLLLPSWKEAAAGRVKATRSIDEPENTCAEEYGPALMPCGGEKFTHCGEAGAQPAARSSRQRELWRNAARCPAARCRRGIAGTLERAVSYCEQ